MQVTLLDHERPTREGHKRMIDQNKIICVIDTVGVEESTRIDITEMTHVDVQRPLC